MSEKKRLPREDANQRAFRTLQEVTGEAPKTLPPDRVKDPAAVALGSKGGKARRDSLTPEQRKAAAKKAVDARWAKTRTPSK